MIAESTGAVIFVFASVTLSVIAGGLVLYGGAGKRKRAASRLRDLDLGRAMAEPAKAAGWTWSAFPKLGALVLSKGVSDPGSVKVQLQYAGYFQPSALQTFAGAQLVLTLVMAALAGLGLVALTKFTWSKALLGVITGGTIGYMAPKFILSSLVGRRQRRLGAMPDAVDMLVLCLEGGSSLTAGVNWVADELQSAHPDLGTEFNIIRRKMQMGLTGGEAFRALADRCGLADVRDLSLVLLQSEKYGASLAKALNAFADNVRQERQHYAEEMAQKAAVKILFPTLLCIFPAIFIVLLGPAAFQMASLFAR